MKGKKQRIILKWWQKILLILASTALCVLGAWLLCEKILEPSYVDTMRAELVINEDGMQKMKETQGSEFIDDVLDIRGSLRDELGKVGTREEKGRYYKLLSEILLAEGVEAAPRDLTDLISTSAAGDDDDRQYIRIRLDNKGNGRLEDENFRVLVQSAGAGFDALVFGSRTVPAEETDDSRATKITYAWRGALKDGVAGSKDPANYSDDDYEWIEADPADESIVSDVWMVTVGISKAAVDALPNRVDFYNKHLELLDLLSADMTDSDYEQIARAAGVDADAKKIRDAVTFPISGEENLVRVEVAWDGGQDETGRLAVASAKQAAAVIFRIMATDVPSEEILYYCNMDELNGTYEPYRCEVISKAGAYIQSFYSDRPQFKTDLSMTAKVMELGLGSYFQAATGAGGNNSSMYRNLASQWGKREFMTESSREAYTGIAGETSDLYVLMEDQVRETFFPEEDSSDPSGRTLTIQADTETLIADIRRQVEEKCAGLESTLGTNQAEGKIDEGTFNDAVALLHEQQETVLKALDELPEKMRTSFVDQLDTLFFGYAEDKENYRSIRADGNEITYTVTEDGLEALLDGCYTSGSNTVPDEAIRSLDTEDGYRKILQRADADGPADVLKDSLSFSSDGELMVTVSWSDRTTTGNIARASLAELSNRMTKLTEGRPVRLVADVSKTTLEREQARRTPPATLPVMVIVGLIALIISYAVFAQQPLFDTIVVIFFVIFTFICIFPFYYLFINTISDNTKVAAGRINFLPEGIHLKNYQRIFNQRELGDAALVTVSRTIIGTALMVLTSAWAGYLVTKQKMWRRSFWYRALVVTMYFNAGLIPWYTNMLMLGLTNNFLAYIIPGMVAPYNIILVKTYIESIPGSLEESAIIDGASTSKVFLRIILPLSIPILATIAIFGAVGNWNSFQDSLLLMGSAPNLYTLQHRLYIYLNQTTSINTEQISEQMAQNLMNNGVTTKYTIAMVTIIPILLVYPIMQRYFVKGIMLGAVKG